MKFLCDRCKTRYSIGDERVRGKILKIRCKNCANVITVREGMSDADGAGDPAPRGRPTTAAPPASHSANNGTRPPPALEEEWYVSMDGDQEGPFSLADAQRWVAGKPADADLHCWSEGFDDWLPVDKVSHFRGLRRKPASPSAPPAAPPPVPRAASGRVAAAAQPVEPEPKPLFAATMAALEAGATARPAVEPALGLPSMRGGAPVTPSATPPGGIPRSNGSPASGRVPQHAKSGPVPGRGTTGPMAKLPAPAAGKPRTGTVQGVGAGASPGARALAAAFDVDGEAEPEPADSHTTVDAPAFNDEIATTAEPVAAKRVFDRVDAVAEPTHRGGAVAQPAHRGGALAEPAHRGGALAEPAHRGDAAPAPAPRTAASPAPEPSDDDLEIGEVSRVVNLADLMKSAGPRASRAPAARSAAGPGFARSTASVPKLPVAEVGAGPGPEMPDPAALGLATPSESAVAPPSAVVQRRGLIALIAVAAVLLLGVVGVVVWIVTSKTGDDTPVALHRAEQIDTSRPEDIARRGPLATPGSASAATSPTRPHPRWIPSMTQRPTQPPPNETPSTDPNARALDSQEIENEASKQSFGTQRCYMRAQRGVDAITVGEVRRIDVTLTIDKQGAVSSVQLSSHASDSLGKCLVTRIKNWHFRENPGGTFRFTLAFANG